MIYTTLSPWQNYIQNYLDDVEMINKCLQNVGKINVDRIFTQIVLKSKQQYYFITLTNERIHNRNVDKKFEEIDSFFRTSFLILKENIRAS